VLQISEADERQRPHCDCRVPVKHIRRSLDAVLYLDVGAVDMRGDGGAETMQAKAYRAEKVYAWVVHLVSAHLGVFVCLVKTTLTVIDGEARCPKGMTVPFMDIMHSRLDRPS